ncbi:phosphinothricin N-acetyltransferase [Cylindrobasidium torrendii FP15055 ss-10]|uniref:Phosphinothricin N-acetyltransferase n=1 Tax=Cylindrobasidium torrendii FP15055 ss-10 TaxID=1314674 RepID=A0A0D7AYY8_9AGAR|nr:phosphinothricin N-acetyltransferase [Cylindrobasidium torrendii FP15055 ss-10]
MVDFTIRAATEDDASAIQEIYAHHVLHGLATFEVDPPPVDEIQRRWKGVVTKGMPYLVAENHESLVLGYGYISHFRERVAYNFTLENSVYLRHDATGQGIGKALLKELIGLCEKGPWRQMVAAVGNSENLASIRLHQSMGFRLVGTLKDVGFKHGRWVDVVMLQRELGNGGATLPAS